MTSQNDLVQVTRLVEVTPGVVASAARDRVYGREPSWAPEGGNNTGMILTGEGEVHDIQAALRAASVTIPSELVHELNTTEWEDVLRDEEPSALTFTGAVTFTLAGTQLDGSTGPTIEADSGTPFSTWVGVAEGCVMEILNAADTENAWPRAIKAISGDQIDLEPDWIGGGVGEFGEPIVDAAADEVTINVGAVMKNRAIEDARYVNFEFNYTDQTSWCARHAVPDGLGGQGHRRDRVRLPRDGLRRAGRSDRGQRHGEREPRHQQPRDHRGVGSLVVRHRRPHGALCRQPDRLLGRG
jgi:hypothetical protein